MDHKSIDLEALSKKLAKADSSLIEELVREQKQYQKELEIFDQKRKEIQNKRAIIMEQISAIPNDIINPSLLENSALSSNLDVSKTSISQIEAFINGNLPIDKEPKNISVNNTSSSLFQMTDSTDFKDELQEQLSIFNQKHGSFLESISGIKLLDNSECLLDDKESAKLSETVSKTEMHLSNFRKYYENIKTMEEILQKKDKDTDKMDEGLRSRYDELIKDLLMKLEGVFFNYKE